MKEEFSFAVIPEIHFEFPRFDSYDSWIYRLNQWQDKRKEGVVGKELEKRFITAINLMNSLEIEFAVTVGDLAWAGALESRLKVKEILDELKVPWVPVLGNHGLLPYTKKPSWGGKSKGIEYFEEVFKETFQRLSNFFDNWERPESEELLENYGFTYKSTRFIVVDNVNRRRTPLSKRTQMVFLSQGSKEWLQKQLSREEKRKIILSHSPLLRLWFDTRFGNINAQVVNITGHWHKEIRCSRKNMTTFVIDALFLKPVITVVKVLSDEIQFHTLRIP